MLLFSEGPALLSSCLLIITLGYRLLISKSQYHVLLYMRMFISSPVLSQCSQVPGVPSEDLLFQLLPRCHG